MIISLLVLLGGFAEAAPSASALSAEGRLDEALGLLADQLPGSQRELTAALLSSSPRLAWVPVAEALSAHSSSPAVAAWTAAARMRDPAQRTTALATLRSLHEQWPDERRVRRYLAEGYLLAGQPERAAFVDAERVSTVCTLPRTAAACADQWVEAGELELAEVALERALGGVSPAEKARLLVDLARIERRLGRDGEAADHLQSALGILPGDAAISSQLIDARLAISQVDAARALLPDTTGSSARDIEAVSRLVGVDPASAEAAVSAAWTLAPEHPRVIAARAHWLLANSRAEEAMEVLAPALQRHGAEEPLLSLFTWGAAVTGASEQAEVALRSGLASARDGAAWSARLDELSRFMMMAAEADKAAGRSEQAIERYQLAAALTSDTLAAENGLAGALWAAGDLRGAELAYARAAADNPTDRTILLSRVRLLQSMDRLEEGRMVIIQSGLADAEIRALEQDLEIGIRARTARRAVEEGRLEEAAERYRSLELDYPGSPMLLHELADVLLALGRYDEAATTYARAQRSRPDDPWLQLGEANARIAAGDLEGAREILDALDAGSDQGVADAQASASVSLRRGEAAVALDDGRSREAFDIYSGLYDEIPDDPWTLLGIAGLYSRHDQPGAAFAFYQAAWLQDPSDPDLIRGRISGLIALGELEAAQMAAAGLMQRHPSEEHLALVQDIDRRQFLLRVSDAIRDGRVPLAEEQLRARLASYPDDHETRALYAELLLLQGETEAAREEALRILDDEPANTGALGVLRASGASAAVVHDRFAAADVPWTVEELPLLELEVLAESVQERAGLGQQDEIVEELEDAQRRYGNAEPRRWVVLGAAWLGVNEPLRAQAAFEVALSLDPDNPDAVRGLSGALQAQGRTRAAGDVVEEKWLETGDPRIGEELVSIRRKQGQRSASELLADEVAAASRPAVARAVEPLPLLDAPAGQAYRDDPEAPQPLQLAASAGDDSSGGSRLQWDVGLGQVRRPGDPGAQQLTARFGTLSALLLTESPLTLGAEFVPLQVSDGVTTTNGTVVSGIAVVSLGPVAASARLGTTPLGFFDTPRLMWRGALNGVIAGDFFAELETTRAPVTDSTTSWLGGVTDTWVSGQLIYAPHAEYGVLGRFGEATSDEIGVLPWEQAMVWGIWPIQEDERFTLSAWGEGMALLHDRQSDSFTAGDAGMFSPRGYYAAAGRLVGDWRSEDDTLGLCGVAGVGPQYIIGEETLYLGPGVWLGYSLEAELSYRVSDNLTARAGYHINGTWGRWYQDLALIQIGNGVASPSPVVSSLVHGPPLVEPRACLGGTP